MNPIKLARSTSIALILVAAAIHWAATPWATAAPLPEASPESQGMSSERLAKIGVILEKAIDGQSFPGAVVMVARNGKLVYSQALGKQNGTAPMAEDSIFRIYSMTKPLVSVAAMLLVEDGKLDLADPVGKTLPGFDKLQVSVEREGSTADKPRYDLVPAERPMTVHDLLRHTAGLAYGEITRNAPVKEGLREAGVYRTDLPFDARGMTPKEQIARMAKVPLAFQPGTVWHYSLATDVLGRVVEAASGQRLADFMTERISKPLGLGDTGFWVPAANHSRIAEPHAKDYQTGKPIAVIDVTKKPMNDSGGAGGVSTAGDYLRFCQMMLNGGELDGVRLLSRTTVRLMAADHLGTHIQQPIQPGELAMKTKGYTFGLGFGVRTSDGIAKIPGSAGEYYWGGYAGTFFWIDPEESLVAVLMTQAPTGERAHYRRLFKQLVYQAIVD